jgi:hypothetical protein
MKRNMEFKSNLALAALMALLMSCTRQTGVQAQLIEGDRLKEYAARNYTWPLEHVVPDTPGWTKLMERRFRQLDFIQDSHDRYNAYIQTMSSALVAPNFTENGWGLTRAPQVCEIRPYQELMNKLIRCQNKWLALFNVLPLFL